MEGLVLKDLYLLRQQKNTLFVIFLIAIILSFSGNETSFIVSYLSLIATTLAVGTITYDNNGCGMAFLFTLPASRIDYMKEKYVFSITFTTMVWTLAVLLTFIINQIRHTPIAFEHHLSICGVILGIVFLTLSLMLPIQLKYGEEKSRLVMILVIGAIAAVVLFGTKLGSILGIDVLQVTSFFKNLNPYIFGTIFLLCILLIINISYRISINVILKKEF